MIELFSAIALWCGSAIPNYGRSISQVEKCRERLIACLLKPKSDFQCKGNEVCISLDQRITDSPDRCFVAENISK